MTSIGEKIRIQRLIKSYSQEYMSFALDISQAAYSNLERGETDITVKRIFEIAEILEISPFILMPKPRFSTYINYHSFFATTRKIRTYWRQLTCRYRSAI